MPINKLLLPITSALKTKYYDPFYDDLFDTYNSTEVFSIPVYPSSYSPIYEGREGEILRGTNGQFISKPVLYYSFEAIINDSREIVWHLMSELIDSADTITVYDFILVPYQYRDRGYVIRQGIADIRPQAGNFSGDIQNRPLNQIRRQQRLYSDFKLRFDQAIES